MYLRIKASPFFDRGIFGDPVFPAGISFTDGAAVQTNSLGPLTFESNCDTENPPRHYMGGALPVWTSTMMAAFRSAGVDNFQAVAARISGLGGEIWDDYFAINILGSIAVADLGKSKFIEIMKRPSGAPFLGFQELVIDPAKANNSAFFRLAENPIEVLIHERIVAALKSAAPAGGWGFLTRQVATA